MRSHIRTKPVLRSTYFQVNSLESSRAQCRSAEPTRDHSLFSLFSLVSNVVALSGVSITCMRSCDGHHVWPSRALIAGHHSTAHTSARCVPVIACAPLTAPTLQVLWSIRRSDNTHGFLKNWMHGSSYAKARQVSPCLPLWAHVNQQCLLIDQWSLFTSVQDYPSDHPFVSALFNSGLNITEFWHKFMPKLFQLIFHWNVCKKN